MAIVFISPKVKQVAFFRTVILILVLSLIAIPLGIFVNKFINKAPKISQETISQPNIAINLSVIDSDAVLHLEPFTDLEAGFAYVVKDKDGKEIQGNISAANKETAQKLLEDSGMTVISLQEVSVGNDKPFVVK